MSQAVVSGSEFSPSNVEWVLPVEGESAAAGASHSFPKSLPLPRELDLQEEDDDDGDESSAAVSASVSPSLNEAGFSRPKYHKSSPEDYEPENAPLYGLYVTYSRRKISEIMDMLQSFATENPQDSVASIRVDVQRVDTENKTVYEDTNRTIVTLRRDVFDAIKKDGYNKNNKEDFRVVEYDLSRAKVLPKGASYAFYIKSPVDLNVPRNHEIVRSHLHTKLTDIVTMGFLKEGEFQLEFPLKDRASGTYHDHVIVTFDKKTPRIACVISKVILDRTKWPVPGAQAVNVDSAYCHVAWCRTGTLKKFDGTFKANKSPRFSPRT